MTDSSELPFNVKEGQEIGHLGIWTVSSCHVEQKIECLRDNSPDTYWQSDGPLPHSISIRFPQKTRVKELYLRIQYDRSLSYTPSKVLILASDDGERLQDVASVDVDTVNAWVQVPLCADDDDDDDDYDEQCYGDDDYDDDDNNNKENGDDDSFCNLNDPFIGRRFNHTIINNNNNNNYNNEDQSFDEVGGGFALKGPRDEALGFDSVMHGNNVYGNPSSVYGSSIPYGGRAGEAPATDESLRRQNNGGRGLGGRRGGKSAGGRTDDLVFTRWNSMGATTPSGDRRGGMAARNADLNSNPDPDEFGAVDVPSSMLCDDVGQGRGARQGRRRGRGARPPACIRVFEIQILILNNHSEGKNSQLYGVMVVGPPPVTPKPFERFAVASDGIADARRFNLRMI